MRTITAVVRPNRAYSDLLDIELIDTNPDNTPGKQTSHVLRIDPQAWDPVAVAVELTPRVLTWTREVLRHDASLHGWQMPYRSPVEPRIFILEFDFDSAPHDTYL